MSWAGSHRQRIMRLYRHSLKACLDWVGDRQQWYPRVRAIRAEFEANRNVTGREQAEQLLVHGEKLLEEFRHPDPQIPPYYPGGNMYSRNPPMPKEVKYYMNYGREDYE